MNIIIDYGLGNINSVQRAFKKAGIETLVSGDVNKIKEANSIILPGVGAFRDAIRAIKNKKFDELIYNHIKEDKPLIGICLGMQLLYEKDFEHGEYEGLGILKGEVREIETDLKLPHMGWNKLIFNKPNDPILKYIKEGEYVYYIHSYYAANFGEEVVAYSDYDIKIPGIVKNKNVYGIQFHPEKSGKVGHNILKAYSEIIGE